MVVELNRDIDGGETLYARARRGSFGQLDCAKLKTEVEAIPNATGSRIDGPLVDPKLTQPFYGPEWGQGEPTAEMLAALEGGTDSIIDVCLMDGDEVVYKIERDLFAAWDDGRKRGFGGKADDQDSGEQRINSPVAYGQRCVGELGEIPFFEKTGEGTYSTYNCLESTAIPLTVTNADGTIETPQEGTVSKCDNPQYIYSLCEAGPRVASRTNDQGTRWVLLCRKSIGGYTSDQYNDIAMIGHNPFTGKTCYFQNALYQKKDGGNIPHPADVEKSQNLWSGVHGGIGSGIQCGSCHDADPFIHTPWIDGAKDANGRPIVPKMGVDADLPLGANDTPYAIVNRRGQAWTMPQHIVSEEANACVKCHRIGSGRWADSWLKRLEGTDTAWTDITTAAYNEASHRYWMPPDTAFAAHSDFTNSEFQTALNFIQNCAANPSAAGCQWEDVPETLGDGGGGLLRNPVDLPDDELAKQASTIIGMNKDAMSDRCAECHAPNQTTLRNWLEATTAAKGNCLAEDGGGEPREEKIENVEVAQNEFKVFGPYEVATAGRFEVFMTGTGDGDLYVKRGAEVTENVYDCRPYAGGSEETCDRNSDFLITGPAKFWVGVKGYAASVVNLRITYTSPGTTAPAPLDVVNCFRMEPSNPSSPFTPTKTGIYAAAAHLGWFQDLFKTAYPEGENGNTADTWALEYGNFKRRVQMPKGNHPRFSQGELDIVAEWFARGLPKAGDYIPTDSGPRSCTPSISSAVQNHVNTMETQGWEAINRARGLQMYGCGSAVDPRECLTSKPDAQTKPYGQGWTNFGKLRVLRELSFRTVYWMRSSPDGRFVANGANNDDGGVISDLQTNKDISVKAAYDPGFFPDNHGWLFQGTPIDAGFCTMGLLLRNPDRINFSESACSAVNAVGLYQHLGAATDGGDYFAINSGFESDDPGGVVNHDPEAGFGESANITIVPMIFDGTRYTSKPSVESDTPHEGDSVLSPSSKLVISRIGNEDEQVGYVLRKLNATPNASSYDISTTEIARYCVKGAKPAISFDEKYFVAHHYVSEADYADLGYASATDPAFQDLLSKGASNIILVNMLTGARTRVTTMHPGQYAIYPHFRSDGWIYFLVRDEINDKEYVVGSDAALRGN
ncbi:MAG: PPC domain-containing protein [Kofleriaceae bacterium]